MGIFKQIYPQIEIFALTTAGYRALFNFRLGSWKYRDNQRHVLTKFQLDFYY